MRDAGRDQNLPRTDISGVDGIAAAEGGRIRPEIDERDLQHVHGGRPAIRLVAMIVKRFDDAGIVEGGGDLRGLFGELRRETVAEALDFEEVAAIVGPEREGGAFHAVDELGRIGRDNDIADAFFTLRMADVELSLM